MRGASVVILILIAAGCVAPAASPQRPGSGEMADPIVEQHDHGDPSQHAIWTPGMEQLGFSALGEKPNETRGTYGEIDIQNDTAYVAVLGDGGEMPGFVIVNISERAAPKLVSFTPSPETRLADIKGEPSNRFAFVGAEKGLPTSNPPSTVRNLAKGVVTDNDPQDYASRNGIRVYDVSDPKSPKMVAFGASDSGCHMLYYKAYAGGEWIFCIGIAVNIYKFDRAGPSVTFASRYEPAPSEMAPFLVKDPAGAYGEATFATTPHDITVLDDKASGKTIMYTSYWDLGLRIVDVTDPTHPAELSKWVGEGSKRYVGSIHTAMGYETPEGKRMVYAIPELFTGDSVPAIFVLDATDLAAPKYVGEWAAPGEHPNDGIRFSTHNFQIVDGHLYLAYYHAGVWVLDISGANAAAPKALGYYLPHETVKTQLPEDQIDVPDTWDVVLKDGYLYAVDINTGLYVLHYKPDALGSAALTSHA